MAMDTAMATGVERKHKVRCIHEIVVGFLLAGVAAGVAAQSWKIESSARLDFTGTDNVGLEAGDRKQDDYYFEVTPAISVRGQSARLKGQLGYQLHSFVYARDSGRSDIQNSLNASGTLEVIEDWFYVDARASIAQQAVSAFGPRPTDTGTTNANQTESRALQISPYIKGRLGTTADYSVRYSYTPFSTTTDAVSSSWTETWLAQISGRTTLSQLGWSADINDERIHYKQGRDSESSRARGMLQWQFDPQFRVNVVGGFERNNFLTFDTENYSNYGMGFEWAPTERTKVKALREHRFFGNGWNYEFTHRTPLTAWSYRESRDVTTNSSALFGAGATAAFDLLFNALASRFRSGRTGERGAPDALAG